MFPEEIVKIAGKTGDFVVSRLHLKHLGLLRWPPGEDRTAGFDTLVLGLVAIGEIQSAPRTPRGDTVKPLTGELRGLWRYRIGDYRLVYRPSWNGRTVMLIAFAGRGSVYSD